METDLLNFVEQGGCSAKLSATELAKVLSGFPKHSDRNLLVDIETHDDGGVYRIRDDYALIQTTDFFPPVCSDPYDFGQIAAANALSDVYAMGGQVLTALNLVMFPAKLPLEILRQILLGGFDKVTEAGGVIMGGHTIADDIPKYGLAVTGWVHPEKITTNTNAEPGDILVLTKPIGTGVIIAARKNRIEEKNSYQAALDSMKQLNMEAAVVMNQTGIRSATDITGFGLLGHALKMAQGSKVTIRINAKAVPALPGVMELIEMGCIPGATFRNMDFAGPYCKFEQQVSYNHKMLLSDAQTSGGLLMAVKSGVLTDVMDKLKNYYPFSAIIGEVVGKVNQDIIIS